MCIRDSISTGAMNDLERVTKQAYGMIAYLGMSDKLPNLCYYNNDEYSFNRPYSEKTCLLYTSSNRFISLICDPKLIYNDGRSWH